MASRDRKKLTPSQQALHQEGGRKQARRTRWENSEAGGERMRDIRDIVGVPKSEDYKGPGTHLGYSLSQMYAVEGWNSGALEEGMDPSHLVHDDQPHLPGMENREAAPLSMIDRAQKRGAERWEDLSPRDQETVSRNVRAKSGATLESMSRSYGAQLDQSMIRASDHGQMPPQFYGGGEPNEVITRTAQDLGISRGAVSALHADNSPQTPFATGGGDSKNPRRYPQDEMARSAVASARRRGGAVHDMSTNQLASDRPPGAMGYTDNFAKSARRAEQIVGQGIPAGETNPNTTAAGYGPKTGPYQRAWTGGTSSQFVSDVHSGGGGMVPHLGTSKDNPKGQSEREDALTTSGFHLMADKAARDAHRARGVHAPVKRGQEAQWVEEQIQRPDLPQTEERVYGPGHVDRDPLTGRPHSRKLKAADPRQMRWDL
jgi:hypothetical protein